MSKDTLHKMSNRHLLRRCLSYFWVYKYRVGFAFISGLIAAAEMPVAFKILQEVIDEVLVEKDYDALVFNCVLMTCFFLVTNIFRFFQTYIMNSTGLLVLNDLRSALYDKIVRLPARYFEKSQVGMLMSRIMNDVATIRMSAPSVVMLIRESLTAIGLVGYAIWTSPKLAMYSFLVIPPIAIAVIYFGKRMRKLGRRGQAQISDVNVHLEERFNGIKVIKAFAKECDESRNFDQENRRLTRTLIKQVLASELSSRISHILSSQASVIATFIGGLIVIRGEMSPGELMTFVGSLAMIFQPIKKLNMCNMNIQQALAGAERVFDIFDSPEIVVESEGRTRMACDFESLRLDNVHFTYQNAEKPALDHVTLDIKAGERVAIVGPSGSGKTTLVNLIPRFYDPQGGAILINGTDIRDYTLESLRLNMGIVSQEAFLFNESIHDNITYAPGEFNRSDVEQAARAAYAHNFIMEQPEGYDTIVGERGAMLSGGQKQRLTIARALLKNPPLLILDEATSALDTESERIVQKALENLMQDRTSIVIAHRLSTVLTADKIVVMEKGRIVNVGRHEELLEESTLYRKLYDMQFSDNSIGDILGNVTQPRITRV